MPTSRTRLPTLLQQRAAVTIHLGITRGLGTLQGRSAGKEGAGAPKYRSPQGKGGTARPAPAPGSPLRGPCVVFTMNVIISLILPGLRRKGQGAN